MCKCPSTGCRFESKCHQSPLSESTRVQVRVAALSLSVGCCLFESTRVQVRVAALSLSVSCCLSLDQQESKWQSTLVIGQSQSSVSCLFESVRVQVSMSKPPSTFHAVKASRSQRLGLTLVSNARFCLADKTNHPV